jgi:hypothetical protein
VTHSVIKPLNISAILPNAGSLRPITLNEYTFAVLLAFTPLALINTAILPSESSSTLPLVIFELTMVPLAILPSQVTLAVHFVFQPLALVCLAIGPNVLALSRYLILKEKASVYTAICKLQNALSILFTILVAAFVAR